MGQRCYRMAQKLRLRNFLRDCANSEGNLHTQEEKDHHQQKYGSKNTVFISKNTVFVTSAKIRFS